MMASHHFLRKTYFETIGGIWSNDTAFWSKKSKRIFTIDEQSLSIAKGQGIVAFVVGRERVGTPFQEDLHSLANRTQYFE
jgi:hypothetical protein